jgi:hypothetical protein
MALLGEMLTKTNDLHLIDPAFAYELYSISEVQPDRLCLENDIVLHGELLPSILSSAKQLAVAICTIGPHLEEKVAAHFARHEPLCGFMLDGIGSAALDSLVQEACQFIKRERLPRGYQASSPLNPGMHRWPLSDQWQIFQLVPAEQIGVHLTSSTMMVPRKSISMAIGMGPELPTWTKAETCARCTLSATCPYRVHNHQRLGTIGATGSLEWWHEE